MHELTILFDLPGMMLDQLKHADAIRSHLPKKLFRPFTILFLGNCKSGLALDNEVHCPI
jgi:hypothetical protein